MEVREGVVGRVFLVKFNHEDDLLAELTDLAREKNIRAAWIQFLGALKKGQMVVGPAKTELPPVPVWEKISEAWEVIGLGNLFWEEDTPRLHLHGALGRGEATLTGCLRQETEVYLVNEALVLEITGINVHRQKDPALGVAMLQMGPA